MDRGTGISGAGWGGSIYGTLGSLMERNELEIVIPGAGWPGSHSVWRFV